LRYTAINRTTIKSINLLDVSLTTIVLLLNHYHTATTTLNRYRTIIDLILNYRE